MLDGFQDFPAVLFIDDLGAADHEFEPLSPHGLDQDGHLELPASFDDEAVGFFCVFHADGHVAEGLLVKALPDLARLHVFPLFSGKGGGVAGKEHGDGRLVYGDPRQGLGGLAGADGVADLHLLDPPQDDNVPRLGRFHFSQVDPVVNLELGDPKGDGLPLPVQAYHFLVASHPAVKDFAHRQPSEIVGVVQVGHQHLEGLLGVVNRRRDLFEDGLEQGSEVSSLFLRGLLGDPLAPDGVQDREIDLFFRGVQVEKKAINFVKHFLRPGIFAINLVDHHDDLQPGFQSFLEDKSRLGQGPFRGIHQEEDAVHHHQGPLHFPSEVCVPGGVQDVDLDILPVD